MARLMYRVGRKGPMHALILSPHSDPRLKRRCQRSESKAKLYGRGWLADQQRKRNAFGWSLGKGKFLLLIDVEAVQKNLSAEHHGSTPSAILKTIRKRFDAKDVPEDSPIPRALCSMGFTIVKCNKADSVAKQKRGEEYRVCHEACDELFCGEPATAHMDLVIQGEAMIESCDSDDSPAPSPAPSDSPVAASPSESPLPAQAAQPTEPVQAPGPAEPQLSSGCDQPALPLCTEMGTRAGLLGAYSAPAVGSAWPEQQTIAGSAGPLSPSGDDVGQALLEAIDRTMLEWAQAQAQALSSQQTFIDCGNELQLAMPSEEPIDGSAASCL
eukprot:m51a1_g2587 hypothetical protein (327) ;mRNA; r:413189-414412